VRILRTISFRGNISLTFDIVPRHVPLTRSRPIRSQYYSVIAISQRHLRNKITLWDDYRKDANWKKKQLGSASFGLAKDSSGRSPAKKTACTHTYVRGVHADGATCTWSRTKSSSGTTSETSSKPSPSSILPRVKWIRDGKNQSPVVWFLRSFSSRILRGK